MGKKNTLLSAAIAEIIENTVVDIEIGNESFKVSMTMPTIKRASEIQQECMTQGPDNTFTLDAATYAARLAIEGCLDEKGEQMLDMTHLETILNAKKGSAFDRLLNKYSSFLNEGNE